MKGKLFLVQWDEALARQRAGDLREAGWDVEVETQDGGQAYRVIRAGQPDVVVVDLSQKPSHGRELARSLRLGKATRDLPIVFLDGDDANRAKTRNLLPGAIFCPDDVLPALLDQFAR
ncbi:MAG: hypothetical protein JW910_01290 [Anaerolineae bacterium]|nr:hypothetical protein [Anaerolineae bacterium]